MRANDEIVKHTKKLPRLSDDEEKELATKCLAGDKAAGEKLVLHNMMYALKVAAEWSRKVEYRGHEDDVVQGAIIGLIEATEKYNGSIRFAIYARRSIRWGIEKNVRPYLSELSLPMRISSMVPQVKASMARLSKTIEYPEVADIMEELGLPKNRLSHVKAAFHVVLAGKGTSLDYELGDSTSTMHELMEDVKCERPDKMASDSMISDVVERGLDLITTRQAQCIRMMYGIGGGDPMTVTEIADELGVTSQSISYSIIEGMDKLRGEGEGRNYSRNKFKFIWNNKEELL